MNKHLCLIIIFLLIVSIAAPTVIAQAHKSKPDVWILGKTAGKGHPQPSQVIPWELEEYVLQKHGKAQQERVYKLPFWVLE